MFNKQFSKPPQPHYNQTTHEQNFSLPPHTKAAFEKKPLNDRMKMFNTLPEDIKIPFML